MEETDKFQKIEDKNFVGKYKMFEILLLLLIRLSVSYQVFDMLSQLK
jgi:hypothetical protein